MIRGNPSRCAVRIGLRSRPVLRDRVFLGAVGAALLHGGYLVYPALPSSLLPYLPPSCRATTAPYAASACPRGQTRTGLYDKESK
eukprot:SM000029S10588  [mRNA]  locus=s29:821880:822340:- [translate_table: standard]